jgi:hypothetical protein
MMSTGGVMDRAEQIKAAAPAVGAIDDAHQKQSQDVTKRLVELFGDADQTSIKMQGSHFNPETGKFSGVTSAEAREKLRAAGLLAD